MSDKELADKIVALGIAEYDRSAASLGPYEFHNRHGHWDHFRLEHFVTDWRIAGILIEECERRGIDWIAALCDMSENAANEANESIPRAIIEACVEALNPDD